MGDRHIAARRAGRLVLAAWAVGIACAACGGSDSSSAATSAVGNGTVPAGGGAPAPGGAATSGAAATSGGAAPSPGGGGAAGSTGAGLPFHYQSTGQGGSASFTIPSAGTYKVDWTASGVAGAPACTVSLGLSADTSSYSVVDGVQVGPADKKSGSTSLTLAAGGYRAVEGGGCGWSITVHPL